MGARATDEQIKQMRKLYAVDCMTQEEVARAVGVHINTVYKYVKGLAFGNARAHRQTNLKRYVTRLWPIEDLEYLVEWYGTEPRIDIAFALDKTRGQVDSKLQSLRKHGVIEWKNASRDKKYIKRSGKNSLLQQQENHP